MLLKSQAVLGFLVKYLEKHLNKEWLEKKIIVMEIIIGITLIAISTYFYFRNWYLDKQIQSLIES
jgi:hypothetical protein